MRTHSPNETRELAKRLAKELRRGDVLLLWGDLGAGKSEFTRGLAQGLGVTATVTSPSFTILNVYDDGRLHCEPRQYPCPPYSLTCLPVSGSNSIMWLTDPSGRRNSRSVVCA